MTTPNTSSESFKPERVLIGEPAIRTDGQTLSLFKEGDCVLVEVDGIFGCYSDEEIALLGDGNWGIGFMRVAQAAYSDDFRWGGDRPLSTEIKVIKRNPENS